MIHVKGDLGYDIHLFNLIKVLDEGQILRGYNKYNLFRGESNPRRGEWEACVGNESFFLEKHPRPDEIIWENPLLEGKVGLHLGTSWLK